MSIKVELEHLQALFAAPQLQAAALKIVGERIYRSNIGGRRYYSRKDCPNLYLSLTSFLGATETSQEILNRWRIEKALELGSIEAQEKFVQATADYGTALHELIAEFVKKGKLQVHDVELWALERFNGLGWQSQTIQAAIYDFVRDFAAIVQFFYDYNVEILAIELPVYGCLGSELDADGNSPLVATCIDIVCNKDAKLYDKTALENRKRERAGINLKSGRVVTDNHGLQLAGEMMLFNECFGDITAPLENVYNLAPCDWRDKPTYKLTNQTKPINIERFKAMVKLGLLNGAFARPKKQMALFNGCFVYGENPSNLLTNPSLADYLTNKSNEPALCQE